MCLCKELRMPIPDHLRKDNSEPIWEFRLPEGITRKTLGPIPHGANSRFYNCLFALRDGEESIENPVINITENGFCKIDLVGYAIIPVEMFNSLIDMSEKYAIAETTILLNSFKDKPVVKRSRFKNIFRKFFSKE